MKIPPRSAWTKCYVFMCLSSEKRPHFTTNSCRNVLVFQRFCLHFPHVSSKKPSQAWTKVLSLFSHQNISGVVCFIHAFLINPVHFGHFSFCCWSALIFPGFFCTVDKNLEVFSSLLDPFYAYLYIFDLAITIHTSGLPSRYWPGSTLFSFQCLTGLGLVSLNTVIIQDMSTFKWTMPQLDENWVTQDLKRIQSSFTEQKTPPLCPDVMFRSQIVRFGAVDITTVMVR